MLIRSPISQGRKHSSVALLLVLSACMLSGCTDHADELRAYAMFNQQVDKVAMQEVFEQRSDISLVRVELEPGLSAVQALLSEQTDLSMLDNSTPFEPGIRVVLPIYRSVLHLLVKEGLETTDEDQPFRGMNIYIAGQPNAGHAFLKFATRRQQLDPGDYTLSPTLVPGETDIIIHFGPIIPSQPSWYQPGYRLVSLDQQFKERSLFYQEGIEFEVPQMDPISIPPLTYLVPGNEGPIDTLAVDTLLVTRKSVDENLIYELTRALIEQKPQFTAIAPNIFSGINESFDPLELNFPLHRGARRYLNRDEPGLLERYADTISMLVYLAVLLVTSLLGFARWRSQRKKDRIDVFYTRIFSIRQRSVGESWQTLIQELDALEREAFESLIAEKLAADESFRIFTELLAGTRATLKAD